VRLRGGPPRVVLPEPSSEPSADRAPCLVYLARAVNGPEPLRAFAAALRRHPPGVECELVLAMKGFSSPAEARPQLEEVAHLEPRALFFPDVGPDISLYLAAAGRLRHGRYCFVNSFSIPLAPAWLAKLDAALGLPRTGMVGATGSWTSTPSWTAFSLGLPSAYRGALLKPAVVREQLLALQPELTARGQRSALEILLARARTLRTLPEYERFPAYHLRTNAFMISHATLCRLRLHAIRGKSDALLLECGRNSLTRQVQRLGLRTLVVDRAGAVFDRERWDRSNTFHQGDQEGLLVADNRTRLYQQGDPELRSMLAGVSWGSRARPRTHAAAAEPLRQV
jgi:hypothetical protein